jgi:hypothetical protein
VKDISDVFDHFRVSARAIWNTAFWPDVALRNWDSVEQFDEMQRILFSELVLRKTEREWPLQDIFEKAIPFFRIVPTCHAPILIQNPRSARETGYWDHPLNREARLTCCSSHISIGIEWITWTCVTIA